ncbi:MAG: acyltransferase family protein [Anaerolineae bacterium]
MAQISLQAKEESPVQTATRASSRLFFIDHLRAVLLIFVVLHHVAMVYGASAPFYYVEPPFDDPLAFNQLMVFALSNQAWHMGAFFLLAGYFTPRSFDRKGSTAFLKGRLIRLGIPLLVYIFILNPISELGTFLMPSSLTGITGAPTLSLYPELIGLGPLWFVAMLLVFNFVYMAWRWLTRSAAHTENRPPLPLTYLQIALFVLVLAVVSYFWRIVVPLGQSVNVFVDFLNFPSIAYLPQYTTFFVLGIVAYRNDWFRTLPSSMGVVGFVFAGLAAVALFPLAISGQLLSLEITPMMTNAMGNGHWQSAVYVLWDSIFAVGMTLGSITLFRRFFNEQGWLGTFLAQHSYAVYVLHIPIVVYLAYALRLLELPTLLKAGVAAVVIVPVCFIVAYLVRKLPYVARVL